MEEHLNSYNSPYKFNGKELDDETGNYYYGARYYNPKWSIWLSVDPMAEKYPGWSPYNYTLNNPVNFTDPTGMSVEENPVYDSQGNYRGDTEEGFTGEPIIYDGKKDFTSMSKDELVNNNGGTYLSNEGFNSLHPDSRDKIESHITNYNLDDGLNIDGEIKIKHHIVNTDGGLYNANEGTPNNLLIKRGVHKDGSSVSDEYFKPTVENIRNLINIHEVRGHVLNNLTGDPKDHFRIFEMQINHLQFNTTTKSFKGFHLNHLYNYGENTGNNILSNSKYKSLYYKFGYPFYKSLNKN
ncbi:RHS repeat-associated core domain-containing protein [Mesonia aestuariivivens]|uniref:RHS repeat-associated core domain-containing protein n=1 Tax=Mesonia aestuariivivens TaxID=2796128 RepID=UPI0034E2D97E